MTFGVTDSGFNLKRYSDVRDSLVTRAAGKSTLATLESDPETVFGDIIDIMSAEIADMWELGLASSNLTNPETVEGIPQDNNYSMVGIPRLAAGPSSVYERYIGANATAIPLTAVVGIANSSTRFSPIVNDLLDVSAPLSHIEITVNDGTADTRSVSIDGNTVSTVSAASDAETIAGEIADEINNDSNVNVIVTAVADAAVVTVTADTGSYNFEYTNLSPSLLTDGNVGKTIFCTATATGPLAANIGEVDQIITAVTGLDSVTNTTVATLGRNAETDTEYRDRRRESLAIIGSGTIDSIVDNVRAIEGVSRVTGVENTSEVTDGEGRPAKTFEIIVTGGEDQEIAEVIWKTKPAGIGTHGNINGGNGIPVKDISDNDQLVEFSRPVERALSVLVKYEIYAEESQPALIQTAITDAVIDYTDSLDPGKDVIPQRYETAVMMNVGGLQAVEAYITASANTTPPTAPTGIAGERDPIPMASTEFPSLDVIDVTLEVLP